MLDFHVVLDKERNAFNIVGKNVKYYRLSKGFSQKQLADRCEKIDRSKISDIENAKEDFMFSTLLEISDGLNITLTDLITDHGDEFYTSVDRT